jgi:hypothetical protein
MENITNFINQNAAIILPIYGIWVTVWKGLALWKAAKKDSKVFFVVILLFNTVGLFEILYFFVLSKVDFENVKAKVNTFFKGIKGKFSKK